MIREIIKERLMLMESIRFFDKVLNIIENINISIFRN